MSEHVVPMSERANDKKMNKMYIFWHISVPITNRDMKMVPKAPEWPLLYSTCVVFGLTPIDFELF